MVDVAADRSSSKTSGLRWESRYQFNRKGDSVWSTSSGCFGTSSESVGSDEYRIDAFVLSVLIRLGSLSFAAYQSILYCTYYLSHTYVIRRLDSDSTASVWSLSLHIDELQSMQDLPFVHCKTCKASEASTNNQSHTINSESLKI